MFKKLIGALVGLAMMGMAGAANAGLMLTDLGGGLYGVTLDPITFAVGSNATAANRMVVEDFFTTDATGGGIDISGDISWSLNGAPAFVLSFETNNGNFNGTAGQIDPNDLLFNFTNSYATQGLGAVSAGDMVTLSTNNMIFSTPGTRLAQSGPFTAHLLNG